jgi:hypothetical protein
MKKPEDAEEDLAFKEMTERRGKDEKTRRH